MSNIKTIDSIILGDNQFFGVNHMSETKGRNTREFFKDINEIKKIMYFAMDFDVKGVFLSTHPEIYKISEMMRKDSAIKNNMSIYANIPYIMKYISMANIIGIPNTIKYMLQGKTNLENLKFVTSSIKSILTMDYISVLCKLIDVELRPFQDLNVKAVFLHNTLCDLCLGYELYDVIKVFDDYIKKNCSAIPAYGTLNLPTFIKLLEKANMNNALIMSAVNKLGYFMNPGVKEYEKIIPKTNHTILAMSTLASGAIKPKEAYEYLSNIGIKHIVVGLSTGKHAKETFAMIKKCIIKN